MPLINENNTPNTQAARDRAAIELLRYLMEQELAAGEQTLSIEQVNAVLMVADSKPIGKEKELEVI